MGHLAKQRDASFFRVFFNPYHYGVLTKNRAVNSSEFSCFIPFYIGGY